MKIWHIIWSKFWRQESHNLHVHFLCGILVSFKWTQVMMFALSSRSLCLLHHVILSLLHNVMLTLFSCFFLTNGLLHNLFTKWDIEKDWLANVTKTLKCCACKRLVDKVAARGYIVIIFNFSPWRRTHFNGGHKLIGWTHNMGGKALVYNHKLFRILISSHTLRLLIFKWINVKASHVFTTKIQDVVFFFIMEVIHRMN